MWEEEKSARDWLLLIHLIDGLAMVHGEDAVRLQSASAAAIDDLYESFQRKRRGGER